MNGNIEIKYNWNLSDFPDITKEQEKELAEEAFSRSSQMIQEDFTSGELHYDDGQGLRVWGWWSLVHKYNNSEEPVDELSHRYVGKQFKHKNGNIYTIIALTNTSSTYKRSVKHPVMVVYIGQNGNLWSRTLESWHTSFSEVIKQETS